jgi:uncharacterized protein
VSEGISPIINTLNAPFWQAAAEDRLVLPYCTATDHAFWPPSPVSPFVTAGSVEWRAAEPTGRVIATAIYRRGFHKAFTELMPYAIGLVELDCGPRLQAHIAHPDAADAPRSGDRVRIRFARIVEGGDPVPTAERLRP